MINDIFKEAQFHSSNFCLTEQLGTPCYVFEEEEIQANISVALIQEYESAMNENIDEKTVEEANKMLLSYISKDIPVFSESSERSPREMVAWIRAYCSS